MKAFARNLLAALAVTFALSHASFAQQGPPPTPAAPEIDPAMAVAALALLGGSVAVIRGRIKAKK
jgi:hypothetical protein